MTVLDYPEEQYAYCDKCGAFMPEKDLRKEAKHIHKYFDDFDLVCRDEEACRRRRNENPGS